MVSAKNLSVLLVVFLLCSPVFLELPGVRAQTQQPTLADTLNLVLGKIQNWSSPWTTLYGQIFGASNQSIYDVTIQQAFAQNDSLSVFFVARLAELNSYSSSTINSTLIKALQQGVPYFTLYDRYMPYAYQRAKELGVPGWNISTLTVPDPAGRYYDEYAESISMLLQLDKLGVDTTSKMAAFWKSTQNVWNPPVITETGTQLTQGYYQYADSDPDVECEMGNFAGAITEYQNQVGTIPNYDNVLTDLETKLLAEGFSSSGWGTIGAIKHATSNPQLRLGETLGAMIALQMLYPYFSSDMQVTIQQEITNSWNGLVASGLYSNGRFSTNTIYGDIVPSDDASSIGSMLLFLDGIVPQTGYLAITASNEAYQDYRTCFPSSEWQFSYQNHSIRIPVIGGNLGFVFGSQGVTQSFPSNGVYDIQFSSNWNSIASITKIANITTAISQTPSASPTPAPSQALTTAPSPTPVQSPIPIASLLPKSTSTPTPTQTTEPTNSPSPTEITTAKKPTGFPFLYIFLLSITVTLVVITTLVFIKVKKREKNAIANRDYIKTSFSSVRKENYCRKKWAPIFV
jgi:hypothetical protein